MRVGLFYRKLDPSRSEWVRVGGSGWEWVEVGKSGCEWVSEGKWG